MTHSGTWAVVLWLVSLPASAQWLNHPTPGMPRTADGKPDLSAPAPRTLDGKPDLSGTWRMGAGKYRLNVAADLARDEIQPWARDVSRRFLEHLAADDGRSLCLPHGPMLAYQAQLFKIVQGPMLTVVLYEANNDYFRQIFTDGRQLPIDPNPTWFGYSIGRWDGDALVVETIGFNGKGRLDAFGHPYTEALRTTERYRRRDFGHIDLEITYEDSGAFARPFTVTQTLLFQADNELLETLCPENERDRGHMVGRTTPPRKVAREILVRYAGSYQIAPGRAIVITVVDDQLWVEQGGLGAVPLNAESDAIFLLELGALGPASRFEFHTGATGDVSHLTWERGGSQVKAMRVDLPSAATPRGRWAAPRTPWGDPDLQGVFTNENERLVPMERPARFEGRTRDSITAQELAQFASASNAEAQDRERPFAGLSPQRFDLKPSRPWLIIDPPDGRIPPLTSLGEERRRAFAAGINRIPAEASDSNLWYRCVSIGLPRSMMPMPDGATYRIIQAPGYVAIQYEMLHEGRVIPLDGRAHVGSAVTAYMGDARGHWEGDTLVIETTNIKGQFQMTAAAEKDLRIVERFTPMPSGSLEWAVTLDDASGWTRPWTFSMPLTRTDESQSPLEQACHEGNYVLRNILSAARADEKRAAGEHP